MKPTSTSRLSGVRIGGLVGVLLIAVPVLAAVISDRYYFEVPYEGETAVTAKLDLALGNVRIERTEENFLFQAEVHLESEKLRPYFHYEERGGTGHLEVDLETQKGERDGVGFGGISAATSSEWILLFGDQAPLDLNIDLGAAKALLDFTDLPVKRLHLDAGASSALMRFQAPNPIDMDLLSISAGASQVDLQGLAYARARRVLFEGGVGRYTLDFSDGRMPTGTYADIEIGMAALTVMLPDDQPVILNAPDHWLCSVTVPNGFVKQDKGIWYSEGMQEPDGAFRVSVKAGMGTINFIRP